MYISELVNTIVISAAIGVFGPAATAYADEGTIIGRIAHGSDDSAVRVCFKHDVAVKSGEELAVVRHTLRPTSPKATPIFESAQVGVVRIATTGDDHCAGAVLVSGSAKWLDWVSIKAGS
jgi:hypothetical protein